MQHVLFDVKWTHSNHIKNRSLILFTTEKGGYIAAEAGIFITF